MSHRINQVNMTWQAVEQLIRRTTIQRLSVPLQGSDLRSTQDAILLWEMTLVDLTTPFGSPPNWNLIQHVQYVLELDLYQLVLMLKECDGYLLTNCVNDSPASYDDFKRHLASKGHKGGKIIFPLRGLIEHWHEFHTSSTFRSLHTAFVFLSRLSLREVSDLESKALQDYLAGEEALLSVEPTDEEAPIIAKWFPRVGDMRYSRLYDSRNFRHGPGTVADCGRSLVEKYKNIGHDQWTKYLDNRLNGDYHVPRERRPFQRVSAVQFVPKSVDKLRTICKEPATLQWYQQGFARNLSDYFRDHWYLSRRISLEDQMANRYMAHLGSNSGYYATIDLSAASDSISWKLVRKWFHDSALREISYSTRSKWAKLPDGSITKLHKYAPMGSALCFPTMCIVFAAIAEASIIEVGERPYTSNYRVYGDDIVIEEKFVPALISRLERNGFKVNTSKSYSYTTSSLIYRESCGGEYLNGDDVTPVRLSRRFAGLAFSVHDSSTIERLIDLANSCYGYLPTVRLRVIHCLNQLGPGYRVPFSEDGKVGLYSPNPTNFHIKEVRYSRSYQENVYRAGGTKLSYPPDNPDDEDIRLYEYLRVTQSRQRLQFPEDLVTIRSTLPRTSKWSSQNYFDLHP